MNEHRMPPPPTASAKPSTDALYLGDVLLEGLGQKPHVRLYPYLLGVNRLGVTAIVANGTISEAVPVGGDANFLAMGLIGQGQSPFLINLRWSHLSGAAIGQVALHSTALFGSQWQPFRFPRPQLVPHDATLTMEFTNLAAAANAVSLYVFGYKALR
jgi:hypothetical protein